MSTERQAALINNAIFSEGTLENRLVRVIRPQQ
jgi:hypothetical protein